MSDMFLSAAEWEQVQERMAELEAELAHRDRALERLAGKFPQPELAVEAALAATEEAD